MDIDADKGVCGTCRDWKGKRELDDEHIFHVKASARGRCERLDKVKLPHGGCDHWTKSEEAENA